MAYEGSHHTLDEVDALNLRLRDASPQEILRAAVERYGDKLALVSSFGSESAVLLHMAAQIDPNITVLFLDTGMLFGQTLDYRQRLAAQLGLTDVRDLRPQYQDIAIHDPSADLWKTDTDACCNIRKVLPLDRALNGALEGFEGWITGRKRFQGGDRAALEAVEFGTDWRIKINPLANWTEADIESYFACHDLPPHPLLAAGYRSIGCAPCTRAVRAGEDPRAGRWDGSGKTECGIHHSPASAERALA